MAKVAFSKLGIKENKDVNTIVFNDIEIEIKKYLSIEDKLNMISAAINNAMDENGDINFLVVSHDSLEYQKEELEKRGYVRDEAGDFDNVAKPLETNYEIKLPEGFKQVYGYDYPENGIDRILLFPIHSC